MSKSSGFQKYSICWVFWHFVCVFVFVVVFVIVFVFVFVSSYDFWIAFIISFQNMYGYRGLWSLRAVKLIIFEVITDIHTYSISTYRLGRMGRVKTNLGIFPSVLALSNRLASLSSNVMFWLRRVSVNCATWDLDLLDLGFWMMWVWT